VTWLQAVFVCGGFNHLSICLVPEPSQTILIGYADIAERDHAYELNLAADSWTYFELGIIYT